MGSNVKRDGFTLLEILVALAILSVALLIIIRLFSADLRGIGASGDYVAAVVKAEEKMREVLDGKLSEQDGTEVTDDGYQVATSVREMLNDRTENLQVRIFSIDVTVHWSKGGRNRSLTLKTLKTVQKEL